MLGLQVNEQWVGLGKASATININNPIFDAGRTFSYPFRIPLSAQNRSIFSFVDRLDSQEKRRDYPAALYLNGLLFERGLVRIEAATDKQLSIYFVDQVRQLEEELEQISLRSLLPTIEVPESLLAPAPHFVFELAEPPTTYFLALAGGNVSFDGGSTKQEVVAELHSQIEAIHPGMSFWQEFPGTQDTLQLVSSEVDQQPFSLVGALGLTLISQNNAATVRQFNLRQHLNQVNFAPLSDYCFPVVRWFDFYKDANTEHFKSWINFWVDGTSIENQPYETKSWEHSVVPMVFLRYVYEQLFEQLDLELPNREFLGIDEINKLVLFNNYALDEVSQHFYAFVENNEVTEGMRYLNGLKSSFRLGDHLPDLSGAELVQAVNETFNLYTDQQDDKVVFVRKLSQLQSPPIDWTKQIEPDYAIDKLENNGYTLRYQIEQDNYRTTGQLDDYIRGAGEQEIDLPISSIYMATQSRNFADILVPISKSAGSSDEIGLGQNDYDLRLLFFRGLRTNENGELYPLASSQDTDLDGNVIGDYSFNLQSDTGIRARFWQNYPDLLSNDTVTKAVRLSVAELIEIKCWQNGRRSFRQAAGQMTGVIKSIQFKASARGISVAKVELIKTNGS